MVPFEENDEETPLFLLPFVEKILSRLGSIRRHIRIKENGEYDFTRCREVMDRVNDASEVANYGVNISVEVDTNGFISDWGNLEDEDDWGMAT